MMKNKLFTTIRCDRQDNQLLSISKPELHPKKVMSSIDGIGRESYTMNLLFFPRND